MRKKCSRWRSDAEARGARKQRGRLAATFSASGSGGAAQAIACYERKGPRACKGPRFRKQETRPATAGGVLMVHMRVQRASRVGSLPQSPPHVLPETSPSRNAFPRRVPPRQGAEPRERLASRHGEFTPTSATLGIAPRGFRRRIKSGQTRPRVWGSSLPPRRAYRLNRGLKPCCASWGPAGCSGRALALRGKGPSARGQLSRQAGARLDGSSAPLAWARR